MQFSLHNTTKTPLPTIPFEKMARDVLGAEYDLSVVFVGNKRSRDLNRSYRSKTYTPNVLSFPLSDSMGEIFLNPNIIRKEAPRFSMNVRSFTGFLFIHALLHLKGYDHGDTMERVERRYLKKYGLS